MALDQLAVIEGDGTQNTVTVTDDPAQNATIQSIVDRLERVLKGQDNIDELRVALTNDDLPGNLDVSVEDQTGDVAVTLGGETVSVDSLPSVDISSQSAGIATESTLDAIKAAAQALDDALASSGTDEMRVTSPSPLDASAAEIDVDLNSQTLTNLSVDLNAQSGPALDVSGATVTVTDDGALTLASNDGTDIGDVGIEDISLVTGQAAKSGSLPVTLASDEDTVPTEQQSPVKVEDSNGTTIDPPTQSKLENVRALLDKLDDALASVGSDTLRTEQQSPVAVEDSTGTQIDPASDPEIRGGATLQDVVDAVVDGALALAIDHPAETRVGLDVSSGVTIGPVPVQRAADIAVAANPTGGGDVSVTVDHTDADGNLFVSDSPISNASSAAKATVPRHGTHVRIDLSGTDTSVNFHLDTHE